MKDKQYVITYEATITQPTEKSIGGWKIIDADSEEEALEKFEKFKKRPPFAKGCISFCFEKLEFEEFNPTKQQ